MKYTNTITLVSLLTGLVLYTGGAFAEDGHEGHAHGEQTVERIPVTKEQVTRLGIKISRAEKGTVRKQVRVPGAIKLNADTVGHVVPQASGIVREVSAALGQKVKKGHVLAVIASRELAEAKAGYLASIERLALAQDVFDRERTLREKKVSSEQDFLIAKRTLAGEKIHERSARQKLLTFGMPADKLEGLGDEADEDFASYEIVAPVSGTIIEKDALLGEVATEGKHLFVIADLSKVWVDMQVSQDNISDLKTGHSVQIRLADGKEAETTLQYVAPIVSADTRTALARAVLENADGDFRPGTFVQATVRVPSQEEALIVPKASVQLVHDHPCVFVWGDAAFELREVVLGVTDGQQIEILKGIRAGEAVASANAFHLKAEYVKSMAGDLGAHHGHSH